LSGAVFFGICDHDGVTARVSVDSCSVIVEIGLYLEV